MANWGRSSCYSYNMRSAMFSNIDLVVLNNTERPDALLKFFSLIIRWTNTSLNPGFSKSIFYSKEHMCKFTSLGECA